MNDQYILAIDQSTSGTKALLFDASGKLIGRCDRAHRQIISDKGWVEHDAAEIYQNTLLVVRDVVEKTGIDKSAVLAVGISNQRETAMAWDKATGLPVFNAIVWQCARGEEICKKIEAQGHAPKIKSATGLHISPYFSAAKLAWILENVPKAREKADAGTLACGTMDSWLIYKLTGHNAHKTDYSNASRTQLFNLTSLQWDEEVCGLFGLSPAMLPEVCDSDSLFGETDFEGFLSKPIPIHSALGDSHGALFGQGCHMPGGIKATYGTGSSVMLNVGKKPVFSPSGVVSSIAWSMGGQVDYVLEGNINYTGSILKWVEELGMISSPKEASALAKDANPNDQTYLVPAFSGLGAPYWDSAAQAILCGMTRSTGKCEIVKAAEESIAYQIADIIRAMQADSGVDIKALAVDGGPTRDGFLMQFQSDILNLPLLIPQVEELSGVGAAYAAGIAAGLYDKDAVFRVIERKEFAPAMCDSLREEKYAGWKKAVSLVLSK